MKSCRKTKVLMLDTNLASIISYASILNNFQNEAVNCSGVLEHPMHLGKKLLAAIFSMHLL